MNQLYNSLRGEKIVDYNFVFCIEIDLILVNGIKFFCCSEEKQDGMAYKVFIKENSKINQNQPAYIMHFFFN